MSMCRIGTGAGPSYPKGSVSELKIVDLSQTSFSLYFHNQ